MVASVEALKGLFSSKRGVAMTNLFQVNLPSVAGISSTEMNLLCKDVTIPGHQIATYEKEIGTVKEKVAYGDLHDDVTMTFLVLNDYGVKKYFDTWQKLAYDKDIFQIGYKSDYVKDIQISQLRKGISFPGIDRNFDLGNLGPINFNLNIGIDFASRASYVFTCTLMDAFPVSIDSIQLNNDQDGLVELRATFTYTKYKTQYYQ